MKKLILAAIVASVAVLACHKKAVPTVTDRTEHPPAPVKPASEAMSADLAAGKTIYETKCTRCHGAKPLDHWTVESWQPILKSMTRKAKLDSTEIAQVTAYVNANAKKS